MTASVVDQCEEGDDLDQSVREQEREMQQILVAMGMGLGDMPLAFGSAERKGAKREGGGKRERWDGLWVCSLEGPCTLLSS
jgi:hypothetical protein